MSQAKVAYLFFRWSWAIFVEQMVHDLIKTNNAYTVHYDETTTSQNFKQVDIPIRYWSKEKDQVVNLVKKMSVTRRYSNLLRILN